jgi:hypothetical protein
VSNFAQTPKARALYLYQTDASHDAAAIARWDDEGGAAPSFADKTAQKYRKMGPSERRGEVPTDLKVDRALVKG